MKPLAINFAWRRRNWRHVFGLVFLTLVGIAAIGSAWIYFQLRAQEDRWQSDWQHLNGMATEKHDTSTPEQQERMKSELRFANRVIDQIDTPWDALFGAVESAYSDQAILLSVEPDTEQREVRLTAEAKDLAAMLAYLDQVRQSPILKGAYLASHQINQQDPQKPVRFIIEARWLDAPPSAPDASPVTPAPPSSTAKVSLITPEAKP